MKVLGVVKKQKVILIPSSGKVETNNLISVNYPFNIKFDHLYYNKFCLQV